MLPRQPDRKLQCDVQMRRSTLVDPHLADLAPLDPAGIHGASDQSIESWLKSSSHYAYYAYSAMLANGCITMYIQAEFCAPWLLVWYTHEHHAQRRSLYYAVYPPITWDKSTRSRCWLGCTISWSLERHPLRARPCAPSALPVEVPPPAGSGSGPTNPACLTTTPRLPR